MSNSHKSKLESLAYSEAKVKGQLSDEFYNETQNIDKLQLNENELAKDHQYKDMLKDLPLSERLQRQKQQAGKDISELPQYQGKKVSAKDLLGWNNNNEESDEDDEEEEDGINTGLGKQIELEGEDDEEEDDEDDDEENLKNDEQLQKLLGQVSDEDEEDDEGEDSEVLRRINGLGEDDEDEDEEEVDEEEQERIDMIGESDSDEDKDQQIYKNKQIAAQYQKQVDSKTQSKSKIDKLMNQIEEEDKQAKPQKQEEKGNEVERAKHTKNQILYWRQQTMDRISLQKSLDLVKKLPKEMNYYSKLNGQKKSTEILLLQNLQLMLKNRKLFLDRILNQEFSTNPLEDELGAQNRYEYLEDYLYENKQEQENQQYFNIQINSEEILDKFSKSQEQTKKFIEDNILKWSQKTNLISQNLKKTGFSQLIQTPIGQAQKALKQLDRLVLKSQLKRNKFRILGRTEQNLFQDTDKTIYDDADYYHELQKEQLEDEGGENIEDEQGLHMNQTKMYLLERKLKQQERLADNAAGARKNVDRRASKARKLRFNIHQKLVNFTNPQENAFLLEGRDEILRSLFGEEVRIMKLKQKEQLQQQQLNGKNRRQSLSEEEDKSYSRKKRKTSQNSNNNQEEDFALI